MLAVFVTIWAIFLVLAALYVYRARHPEQKPLAAYLIFVTVFTAVAFLLFGTLVYLSEVAGWLGALDHPAGAVLFVILVFAPAIALARWQIRRPPRRMPPPE